MKDLQTLKEAYEGLEKEGYVIGELGAVTMCTDGEVMGYPQAVGGCVSGEVMINMHSPYVMALSCLGEDLPCITLQMLSVIGGKVSYSKESGINAMLVSNDGAVCYGKSIEEAVLCCKVLERAAMVYLTVAPFGDANEVI